MTMQYRERGADFHDAMNAIKEANRELSNACWSISREERVLLNLAGITRKKLATAWTGVVEVDYAHLPDNLREKINRVVQAFKARHFAASTYEMLAMEKRWKTEQPDSPPLPRW